MAEKLIRVYKLVPFDEAMLHENGKTATSVEIHGNTNQINVAEVVLEGRSFWVYGGIVPFAGSGKTREEKLKEALPRILAFTEKTI